jgi:flagellar motor protein MotB
MAVPPVTMTHTLTTRPVIPFASFFFREHAVRTESPDDVRRHGATETGSGPPERRRHSTPSRAFQVALVAVALAGCQTPGPRARQDLAAARERIDELEDRLATSEARLRSEPRRRAGAGELAGGRRIGPADPLDGEAASSAKPEAPRDSSRQVIAILEERVENLKRENDRLAGELRSMVGQAAAVPVRRELTTSRIGSTPAALPSDLERRLREIARKHRGAVWEPTERVLRLETDLFFLDGGDELRRETRALITDIADIMLDRAAREPELNLQIVGHTSAETQVTAELRRLHPTDWHLAAHQALAVCSLLEERGVAPHRMGVSSFGSQQPLRQGAGGDEVARRKNARVEIFVLPPDPPEGQASLLERSRLR